MNGIGALAGLCLLLSLPLRAAWAEEPLSCDGLRSEIRELAADSSCDRSDDCGSIDLPPPHGCDRPINRRQIEPIQKALSEYQRYCRPFLYNCLGPQRMVSCKGGRCVRDLAMIGGGRFPSTGPADEHGRPVR